MQCLVICLVCVDEMVSSTEHVQKLTSEPEPDLREKKETLVLPNIANITLSKAEPATPIEDKSGPDQVLRRVT